MTDTLKVLGQLDAAATTTETLYAVRDSGRTDSGIFTQTTTSTLVVCNRNATAITFRVSVHVDNAGNDDMQFIFYDAPLAANSTLTAVLGLTLAQTSATAVDKIKTYVSATGVSFNLFGVETS